MSIQHFCTLYLVDNLFPIGLNQFCSCEVYVSDRRIQASRTDGLLFLIQFLQVRGDGELPNLTMSKCSKHSIPLAIKTSDTKRWIFDRLILHLIKNRKLILKVQTYLYYFLKVLVPYFYILVQRCCYYLPCLFYLVCLHHCYLLCVSLLCYLLHTVFTQNIQLTVKTP